MLPNVKDFSVTLHSSRYLNFQLLCGRQVFQVFSVYPVSCERRTVQSLELSLASQPPQTASVTDTLRALGVFLAFHLHQRLARSRFQTDI